MEVLEFLQYDTMILQRPRIIVGDADFEPGTSASEVWRATNEPPHLKKRRTIEEKTSTFGGYLAYLYSEIMDVHV